MGARVIRHIERSSEPPATRKLRSHVRGVDFTVPEWWRAEGGFGFALFAPRDAARVEGAADSLAAADALWRKVLGGREAT